MPSYGYDDDDGFVVDDDDDDDEEDDEEDYDDDDDDEDDDGGGRRAATVAAKATATTARSAKRMNCGVVGKPVHRDSFSAKRRGTTSTTTALLPQHTRATR